jgi:hypothetical protein
MSYNGIASEPTIVGSNNISPHPNLNLCPTSITSPPGPGNSYFL